MIEGVLCMILDRRLPKEPVKLGRLWVRSDVRSCPTDRFRCSLGRKGNDSKVGTEGIVMYVDVEAVSADGMFAASGGSFSFNCRNFSK